MKVTAALLIVMLAALGGFNAALAVNLKDKVNVDVKGVDFQFGMVPGAYVCAAGHLHVKATVQNLADVALGKITVAGRAFGPGDKLLGTATASTRKPILGPGEKADIDLEFLTIQGPLTRQVKRYEVAVIEAPTAQ